MLRFGLVALAVGAVVLFVGAGPVQPAPSASATAPANTIVNEPVVVFQVNGSTQTGTVHRQLSVYNNGFVTIAKLDHQVFPVNQEIKDVQTANVGSEAAFQLLLRLVQAGAAELPDQPLVASDIPLNTLTVLQGKELALSRTFSWWVGIGGYAGVQQVVNDFVQTHFPGF